MLPLGSGCLWVVLPVMLTPVESAWTRMTGMLISLVELKWVSCRMVLSRTVNPLVCPTAMPLTWPLTTVLSSMRRLRK